MTNPDKVLDLGSSPHARGLQYYLESGSNYQRIIPARAGFTRKGIPAHAGSTDHPRTRGVYS